jgi:hypothetical protein
MTKPSRPCGVQPPHRGTRTLLVVALLSGLGAAGCVSALIDPGSGADPSAISSPATSATTPPVPTAPLTTAAPSVSVGPVTEPSLPEESPVPTKLRTTETVISGRSGTVSWRVRVPKFSGAPAATEVNSRVRAAVNGMIAQTKREGRGDDGHKRRLDGEGTVVTNDGRTAQVTITYGDYLEGTAHPTDYVTTTVVDVARRKPVVLGQVFTHPTAAYKKLEPAIVRAAGEQASGIDRSGLAPKEANWANWQTNKTGMVFVFGDYQLGTHGLREYAVPWSTVEPLLTGYAKRVLAPQ